MNPKSLMIEIETLHREQQERNYRRAGAPTGPTTRYQLDFAFKDLSILYYVNSMLVIFMECNMSLNPADDASLKTFLKSFVNRFFFIETEISIPPEENIANKNDIIMADNDSKIAFSVNERKTYSFYANTNFYVFFRLYQVKSFKFKNG